MKFRLLCLLAMPALLSGAPNKDIVALQREIATLEENIRALQRSLDEKLAAMAAIQNQILDAATKSNTSVAVLESGLRDRVTEQLRGLAGPVAGLNAKMDQMANDFQALRVSVDDLGSRFNKMQTQITDLGNTVKVMQAPPAPPSGGSAGGAPPSGMSAQQIFDNARRDLTGGNLDLAIQGFTEYLKYFGSTELAPEAQYSIGVAYYNKNDFASAAQAFDAVLERFQENPKTPDAMYMKGMALLRSGQRTDAAKEFLNVIEKYPRSEVAEKAKTQRRALGFSVPSSGATARPRSRR